MADRRPKRRCVVAKAQVVPSAIHYVGYVEDDETPEMIMKKFEELERIQKAAEARRQQQQHQQRPQGAGDAPVPTGAGPALTAPSRPSTSAAPDCDPLTAGGALADPASCSGPQVLPAGAGGCSSHLSPSSDTPPQPPPPQQQLPQGGDQAPSGRGDFGACGDGGGGGFKLTCGDGATGADADQMQLDEEALLEVFKQTSIFNMRSALYDNDRGAGGSLLGAAGATARYEAAYGVAYGLEDTLFVGGGDVGATPSDLEEDDLQLMKGFWSDEDFELGGGGRRDGRRRKAGAASSRSGGHRGSQDGEGPSRETKQSRAPGSSGQSRHAMNQVVMQYNRDTNALIRRRVASGGSGGGGGGGAGGADGAGGLVQLRVPPPPLPLSWGRTVRPYQPPEPCQPPEPYQTDASKAPPAAAELASAASADAGGGAAAPAPAVDVAAVSRGFESSDLATFPYDSALGGKQYIAVMVNAGWQPPGASDAFEQGSEAEVMRRFRSLPIPRLCPRGFVLVWAHKGLLQAMCRALAGWGYVYVENLTWVHITPANAIATQRGRHFRRSHSTLLIFRREGEGRDIELRHQRNPDVVFDCVRTLPDGSGWDIPSEVLATIETMLPAGKGAFLELWAPRGQRRPGWDHVCEVR